MSTPNRKKTLRLLAAALLLLCVIVAPVAILKWPSITRRVANFFPASTLIAATFPTSDPVCVDENWVSFDMPNVAANWKGYLESVGIEPVEVFASGTGESQACVVQTLTGPIYTIRQPSTAYNIGVAATIRVPDVTDDAALGALVLQIFPNAETLPFDSDTTFSLKFVAPNGTKAISLDPNSVTRLNAQGFTPAQLFAALDGRYPLPATPETPGLTPTP